MQNSSYAKKQISVFSNKYTVNHFYLTLLVVIIVSFLLSLALNATAESSFTFDRNIVSMSGPEEIGEGFGERKIYNTGLASSFHGVKIYGSWMDADDSTGSMATRWYGVKRRGTATIAVFGTPNMVNDNAEENNQLFVEIRNKDGSVTKIDCGLKNHTVGARFWMIPLDINAAELRIVAVDDTIGRGGWVGFSEPIKRGFISSLIPVLAIPASFMYIIIFIIPGFLIARLFILKGFLDKKYLLLLSVTASSLLSYFVFWIYYFNNIAGKVISVTVTLSGIAIGVIRSKSFKKEVLDEDFMFPAVLCFLAGCMYLSILFLYDIPMSVFSDVANKRFVHALPPDNIIPKIFLDRIYNSSSLTNFLGSWLASDRPPLATAMLIILRPLSIFSDDSIFYQFVGSFMQLLWIPALYSLCGFFEFDRKIRNFILCSSVFSGVFIINSTFIWPKLSTTLFFTFLFLLVFELSNEKKLTPKSIFASAIIGICAALGLLSHGGIVFSLLAFGMANMLNEKRMDIKHIISVFASFLVVYIPWVLFQKLVDPPGNRLFKMHLAGMDEINGYSLTGALRYAYSEVTIAEIVDKTIGNFLFMFANIPAGYSSLGALRSTTFFRIFGTAAILNVFLVILFFYSIYAYCFEGKPIDYKHKILIYFTIFSFTVWPLLMFPSNSTSIHQGSYFNVMLIYILIAFGASHTNKVLLNLIYTANILLFILLWVVTPDVSVFDLPFMANIDMFIVMTVSAILFFAYIYGTDKNHIFLGEKNGEKEKEDSKRKKDAK